MIIFLGTLLTSLGAAPDDRTRILFGVALLGLIAFSALAIAKTRHLTDPSRQRGTLDVLFLAIGLGMVPACFAVVRGNWPEERLDIQTMVSKEADYNYIGYKRMGELIAKNHPGGKLLLIKHGYKSYYDEPSKIEIAMDRGLKDGLNGRVEIVSTELIEEVEDPNTGELLWSFTVKDFDAIVDRNQGSDAIFSMAGLPLNYENTAYWKSELSLPKPALYLTNFWTETQLPIADTFKAGFVKAILTDSPVAFDIMLPVPENAEEAFDRRFFIYTPEQTTLPKAVNAPVAPPPSLVAVAIETILSLLLRPMITVLLFYISLAAFAIWRVRRNRDKNVTWVS